MALTATTLAAAITSTATQLTLTSGTGAAVKSFVKIDSEFCEILDITFSPTIRVSRGQAGTLGVAHGVLSPATIGLGSDFPVSPFLPNEFMQSYGASGAIAIPNVDSTIFINKATLAALTLAVPTQAQNGRRLRIISTTGTAHTVTTTGSATCFNGTTGTATFAAVIGSSMEVVAAAGKWDCVGNRGITFA